MSSSTSKLAGKTVVVVGGSSGLGLGAALALLRQGAHVTIISSSEEKVNATLKKVDNANLKGRVANVKDEANYTEVLQSLAPIDHLIYSSVSKITQGPIADADLSEARSDMEVKFWGSVLTGKIISKHDIIKSGGSLTLTSGVDHKKPGTGSAINGALSAGLLTMTQSLANQLAAKKVRVNCVIPGLVQSELWDKMGRSKDQQKDMFAGAAQALPVGFVATPEDIAEAYLYLVRADYATGTSVTVDGGASLQ